ncbi:ATP-dependent helicase [Sulfurimonas aquatica]|uniref:ATP-dependent helicase n=1 Tax=Sulfurimonas aquatica TaxID=2672570 RepID=A0A975B0A0_9BACT|nr:DEAD/DEAH box helicase [Sulfurimonas aquatica]QSZ41748.1 ATP-dependent helicase [Sulfurimonas aquatica]
MSEETAKPKKKYYDYISVGNRTKQVAYFVEQHDKPVHLELFLKENPTTKTALIVKSKKTADALGLYLKEKAINAIVIHGNHRASQIEEAKGKFSADNEGLLITTSKIYEFLELSDIKRIINYDLPLEPESYFKTLRAVDETGESISFVSIDDEKMLETIELMMKYEMPKEEIEAFTHTALPKIQKKKKKPRHKKKKQKPNPYVPVEDSLK